MSATIIAATVHVELSSAAGSAAIICPAPIPELKGTCLTPSVLFSYHNRGVLHATMLGWQPTPRKQQRTYGYALVRLVALVILSKHSPAHLQYSY